LEDVELDVNVPCRRANGIRHRVEALLVLRDEMSGVVAGERHRAEVAVERHDGREPLGCVRTQRAEVEMLARVVDVAVDPLLLASPFSRQAGVADEQEQEHPDERDEVDREQPRHRGGRPAVARNDDDGRDADGEVEHEDDDQPPRRVERDADHRVSFARLIGVCPA
jgi:hypothetical protein